MEQFQLLKKNLKESQQKVLDLKKLQKYNKKIDSHLSCVVSGLIADAQVLVEGARSEAQYYRFVYKDPIPIKGLTQAVADQALNFGEGDITTKRKPNARPYGVSLLFAGIDNGKPVMYQADPSGTIIGYLARGVGAAEEGIQSMLEKHYSQDLTVDQGLELSLGIMKQVMEEKIDKDLIEVYYMRITDKKFTKLNLNDLNKRISSIKELE